MEVLTVDNMMFEFKPVIDDKLSVTARTHMCMMDDVTSFDLNVDCCEYGIIFQYTHSTTCIELLNNIAHELAHIYSLDSNFIKSN